MGRWVGGFGECGRSLRSVPQDKKMELKQLPQVKANDWRTRERVVLDLFSNLEWVRTRGFFR